MGVIIAVAIFIMIYVFVAVDVSYSFWDFFVKNSETIRNLALSWGALLAIGLALWRSIVAQQQAAAAQQQAEIAQRVLLSNRYQRAVEMLGHDKPSIRIGGINALRNFALEQPDEYRGEVVELLTAHQGPATDAESKRIQDALQQALLVILNYEKGTTLTELVLAQLEKKADARHGISA